MSLLDLQMWFKRKEEPVVFPAAECVCFSTGLIVVIHLLSRIRQLFMRKGEGGWRLKSHQNL